MSVRLLSSMLNLALALAVSLVLVAAGILVFGPALGEPMLSQWPVLAHQYGADWQVATSGVDAALSLDRGVLRVEQSGYGWHWFLRAADVAVSGALLIVGLWLLRRFTGEVRQGFPFSAGSANRLRWVGLVSVAFPMWQGMRDMLWHGLLARQMSDHGLVLMSPFHSPDPGAIQLQFSIDWGFVVAGLLMLVVARAFRVGVELREDSEEII